MSSGAHGDGPSRTVRPRWVWSGVLVGLAGMVVVGAGVAIDSWPVSIVGVVLLGVAALLALRGGIIYDVRKPGAPSELQQVVHGEVHRGVAPGDMILKESVRQHAAVSEARKRLVLREREAYRRTHLQGLGPAGGWLLVAVGAALLLAQQLYPHTNAAQANALRTLLTAILLLFCGVRLGTGQDRRHRVAAGLGSLLGLELVAGAFLVHHDRPATIAVEACCGVLVFIATAVSLGRPRR